MLRIVVLASGNGSNLQAIIDAVQNGFLEEVSIEAVLSNNENAFALERARRNNIKAICISSKNYISREDFYDSLLEELKKYEPDLIVLAGFLVNIPKNIIQYFKNKIINIHPSLIPSFCGKGFYGIRVHEKALERGVKITGATVHFVDEGIDTGEIIIQKAVKVMDTDTAKSLQERVMKEAEWEILPLAIAEFARRRVNI